MTAGPIPHTPIRQWRLSLTEQPTSAAYTASLKWRTFPCRADAWHGSRAATVLSVGPPIRSAEDLEAVVALFVGVDWSLPEKALRQGPQRLV